MRQVLPKSPEYHKLLSYKGRNPWRVVPDDPKGRVYLRRIMYESRERLTIQRLSRLDSQGQKMASRLEQYSFGLDFLEKRDQREKKSFSSRSRSDYLRTNGKGGSFKRLSGLNPGDTYLYPRTIGSGAPLTASGSLFLRGDVNQDGQVNFLDSNDLLRFFYDKEYEPPCLESADVNNDGLVQLDDALQLINYVTHGLSPPALPFPACGRDPDEPGSGKDIGCLSHEAYPKTTEDEDKQEGP